MKHGAFLAVALTLFAGPLQASEPIQLRELLENLPEAEGTTWPFTEIRSSDLFEQPLTAQGHLSIDESGVLVKELTSPISEKIIIGLDEFTVITPTRTYRAKLARSPFLRGLAAGLRGLMVKDADAIQSYFNVELKMSELAWTMTLTPIDKSLQKYIDKLEIAGCNGQVSVVTIYTRRGKRQDMLFRTGIEACSP